jgi:pimeloyl-ACP methyl ester carboxylesterase
MPRTMLLNELTMVVDEPPVATRPPVLLIHGYGGGAWYFDRYQRFLGARGYPTYALNLRGHHDSKPVGDLGRVSFDEYIEDAHEVARHIGQPIVIGHSMGGLLAQKLAESGVARAAVLMCAAAPRGISLFSWRLALRQLKHLPALLRSRRLEATRSDLDSLLFNRIPEPERDALFPRFVADSGRVGRELSLSVVPVDERKVRCPVLVIACSDDRYVVPRVARRLARKYRAPYWEYADHGHFPQYEPGWEAMAGDIARWLESVVPSEVLVDALVGSAATARSRERRQDASLDLPH